MTEYQINNSLKAKSERVKKELQKHFPECDSIAVSICYEYSEYSDKIMCCLNVGAGNKQENFSVLEKYRKIHSGKTFDEAFKKLINDLK